MLYRQETIVVVATQWLNDDIIFVSLGLFFKIESEQILTQFADVYEICVLVESKSIE
jgi:hypothetical protein